MFARGMEHAEKNFLGIAMVSAGVFAALHHARRMFGQPDPKTRKLSGPGGAVVSMFFAGALPPPEAARTATDQAEG